MPKPTYPDVLKTAKWDKEKGLMAKIFKKETGVGAKLTELQTKFDALKFDPLERTEYGQCNSQPECNEVLTNRRNTMNANLAAFSSFPKGVADLATKTATELKKNPLIPKSTLDYLKSVPAAAAKLTADIDAYIKELEAGQAAAIKKRLSAANKEAVAALNESKKFEAEIKKVGDAYVQTRKTALSQMEALKSAALKTKQSVDKIAERIDKTASTSPGTPEAARKNFTEAQKLEAEAKSIFTTFDAKWLKEGSVNTNQVQKDARGNIGKIDGKPELQPFLDEYQRKSNGIFNTIMANVADIISTKNEMEVTLAAIATNVEILSDMVLGSSKSLAEHQKTAQEIAANAKKLAGEGKIIHDKMNAQQGSVNGLVATAKKDPNKIETSHNYITTTIGELERRVAEFTGIAGRIMNSKKRIAVLPTSIQVDAKIKSSMAEVDAAHKGFTAATENLKKMLANAKKVQSDLPPLP